MMKKTILAAVIFILSLSVFSNPATKPNFTGLKVDSFTSNELILTWNLEQIKINKGIIDDKEYSSIRINECGSTEEIGRPEIPIKVFTIGVPDKAVLQYSITNVKYKTVPNIIPLPVARPYVDKSGLTSFERTANFENYNFNPKNTVEFLEQNYFKDMPIVQSRFYPVTYDHSTNTIKYIESAVIRIIFKNENATNSTSTQDKYLKNLYNSYVINYQQAQNWLIPKTRTLHKSSFVPQGPWYKIEVTEDGLYKISPSVLTSAGIDVSTIDPRTFQLYNNGGKPLSRNSMATDNNPEEPIENAIHVHGESDGSFDSGDYILFYGTELGGWNYSSSRNDFTYIQHPYDTKNYYWLTFGNANGKRIEQIPQPTASATTTETYFWKRVHFEYEQYNLLSSGTDWYGYKFFGKSGQKSFNYQISNMSATANPAKLIISFKGGSKIHYNPEDHNTYQYTFSSYLNPSSVPNSIFNATFRNGDTLLKEFSFNSSDYLINGNNQIKLDYSANFESCIAYLDYVEFYYPGDFKATNNYLEFYSNTTGQVINYNISDYSNSDIKVFDISEPTSVKEYSTNGPNNGNLSFKLDLTDNINKRFIAASLTSSSIKNVAAISLYSPTKNLFDQTIQADFIIITPRNYMSYGNEIGNLRNSGESPITSTVVSKEDIYFYFGSGVKDPTAIRNFIRHAYKNWSPSPKYVLLFGDGHYDYRNITISDTNFIPPFEINGINDIYSRESDNYYVDINNTSTSMSYISPDLAIGRLPVESHLDARRIVDKLISYEENKSHDGWQTVLTFVGDDEVPKTEWIHQTQANELSNLPVLEKFNKRRIFLSAYNSIPGGFGRVKPEANNAIIDQLNEGTLFINFVGHGSSHAWAHENVFEMNRDLNRIQNEGKLSIFIAATCTFGKYDNPSDPSFTEALIWKENSGAIAVIAAARGVFSGENYDYNRRFYNGLFPLGGSSRRMGDAQLLATSSSDNYQKFHLFGDPSMFPADPKNSINISPVQQDTLKALSKINIGGYVSHDSSLWQEFNGGATIIVNDAIFENVNTGGGSALNYNLDGPRIFKGEISITNGVFSGEFMIPKSIRYQNRKTGKITIYAWNEDGDGEALGYVDTLLFFGTTSLVDENGPEIDIYFEGQDQFNDGDLVNDSPTLIAAISDENGINLTQEVGHVIEIQIDDETTKDVTSFFAYVRDSYSDGQLKYHLEDLEEGFHQLTVKAWDNLNNPTTQSISFQVIKDDGVLLEKVYNYPNPFSSDTYFTFQTTQESIGAEILIKIYTISGKLIKTLEGLFVETAGFNKIYWDGRDDDGDKIANGVYPYKIIIKNGKENKEKIEKLVILK